MFCRQALVTNTDGIAKLLVGKATLNVVSATESAAAWENVQRRVDFDRMSSATSGTSNPSPADILLFSSRSA
jgi:hypothetical protein